MSTLFHFEKSESEMSEKNSWKMEKVRINWPKLIAKIGLYTYTTHQGWTFYEIMAVFSPMLLSEICDDKMHAKHAKKDKLSLFPLPSVWVVFAFQGEIFHLTLKEMGKL